MNRTSIIAGLIVTLTVFPAAWNLFAAESVVTPAMVGHWEGKTMICNSCVHQRNLAVAVDIHADGSVTGKVDDATLIEGCFQSNRGWLGRTLNLASDYIITGKLDGAIGSAEGIKRDSVFIPMDFNNNAFTAGIITSGPWCMFSSQKVRKEKASLTTMCFKLIRSKSSP